MTDIITITIITGVVGCYIVASPSKDTSWYSPPCKVPSPLLKLILIMWLDLANEALASVTQQRLHGHLHYEVCYCPNTPSWIPVAMLWESLDYPAGKRPPEEAMDETPHVERSHMEENWGAPAELPSNGANITESRRAAHSCVSNNKLWLINNWNTWEGKRKQI